MNSIKRRIATDESVFQGGLDLAAISAYIKLARISGPKSPLTNENLDLPPGFTDIRLRESGDAFSHACAIALEKGAATLVRVSRYDLVEMAIVLEPGDALSAARRAFFACMNALADALAVHAPPERDITFGWPDTLLLDGAIIGGGRLGWPIDCAENQTPDWLVFGAMLRAADLTHADPGFTPGATTLTAEGFDIIDGDRIVEGFARHLMTAFDTWSDSGFRTIGEDYLSRLPKRLASEKRIFDANGDLLSSLPAGGPPQRSSLREALIAPSWYDAAQRMPKSG